MPVQPSAIAIEVDLPGNRRSRGMVHRLPCFAGARRVLQKSMNSCKKNCAADGIVSREERDAIHRMNRRQLLPADVGFSKPRSMLNHARKPAEIVCRLTPNKLTECPMVARCERILSSPVRKDCNIPDRHWGDFARSCDRAKGQPDRKTMRKSVRSSRGAAIQRSSDQLFFRVKLQEEAMPSPNMQPRFGNRQLDGNRIAIDRQHKV